MSNRTWRIRGETATDLAGITLVARELCVDTTNNDLYLGTGSSNQFVGGASAAVASIDDITDVTITSVGNNEILQWNSTSSVWENQTFAEAGVIIADGTVPLTANWDVGAYTITATRFISDIATGTAPFGVSSTTVVTNLNADQLDGNEASAFAVTALSNLSSVAVNTSIISDADVTDDLGSSTYHWKDVYLRRLRFKGDSALSISSGAVTVTGGVHTVDTEGDASSDDLDTISGGTEGDLLILYPENASRTVWITDAGNIDTPDGLHYPIPDGTGALLYYDGSNWRLLGCGGLQLNEDTTINFTSAQTAAQINAIIAALPVTQAGHTLTLQLGDGTYNSSMDETILVADFDGTVYIEGNAAESGLHTDQAVHLDFSGNDCTGLHISQCKGYVRIRNLKITIDTDTEWVRGIYGNRSTKLDVTGCYILGSDTSQGYGIQANRGVIYVTDTYVSNMARGIAVDNASNLHSDTNDETGTDPAYGLYADAGNIFKESTQPDGSTANEGTANGGQIN